MDASLPATSPIRRGLDASCSGDSFWLAQLIVILVEAGSFWLLINASLFQVVIG